jgi:streptomycin 6-kinase
VLIPAALEQSWQSEAAWLAELPRLVDECRRRWSLTLEEPIASAVSLVVPAGELVLKLNAPSHLEADREADALERWAGRGAVRLIARDDDRRALLVERCRPGRRLWDSEADQAATASELLARLPDAPGLAHPFRLLADEAQRWLDEVPANYELGGRPFEPALLTCALEVFASVDRTQAFLVNQDLHGANILSAAREPWLVVDPKPLVGERELDGVGLLRNAAWRGGPAGVRRSLDALASTGRDRERLRAWGVAHAVAWGYQPGEGWSSALLAAARTILRA